MLESFVERFKRKKVVKTSDKVLTTLYQAGRLDVEIAGSARAVVEITQQPDLPNLTDKLNPKEIKDTAKALSDGLQDPGIQSSTLFPEAIQAMPVLADEYQRRIATPDKTQPQPGEVRMDSKTTLIQPVFEERQMDVSRRGFLNIAKRAAVVVGLTPIATTVGAEYALNNFINYRWSSYEKYQKEIGETMKKFNATYPEKPIQLTGVDEIKESLEYKKQRDTAWYEIKSIIDSRHPDRENFSIVGQILVSVFFGVPIAVLGLFIRQSVIGIIDPYGNFPDNIKGPLKYL